MGFTRRFGGVGTAGQERVEGGDEEPDRLGWLMAGELTVRGAHESPVRLVVLGVVMVPLKLSVARVAARAASGGHDVPKAKLRPRYARLWHHIATATPECARAVFYDNSADDGPYEIASYRFGIADYAPRWPDWVPAPLKAL